MDSFATAVSLALQYGVPLQVLVDKFSHTRFEPSGFTGNPKIPIAKSIIDYIFRWMGEKFLSDTAIEVKVEEKRTEVVEVRPPETAPHRAFVGQSDAPPCTVCGELMIRNGACYKCENCGTTNGCS
jgi:ribonucleoside-diphosphate reductase alpha chain